MLPVKPKPDGWDLFKKIPDLFNQKTISIQEFNEKLSQPVRLSLNKKESFELVKQMKKHGFLDFQSNKGRILFK